MSTLISYRAETIPEQLYFHRYSKNALNITSQVWIGYNSNREYNRLGYFRGKFLTNIDKLKKLSYEEFSNTLLPSPYPTHCRYYGHSSTDIGKDIIDPGTCYDSCVADVTKKEFDTILPGIFLFDESIKNERKTTTHLTAYEMLNNSSLLELRDKLSDQCSEICNSPACIDTFYIPVILSMSDFPDPSVFTYTLQSPKIDTSCDPKLSTIDYLTNIFSTFGFWIGLSVLSAIEIITNSIVNWIKNRIENRTGSRTRIDRGHPRTEARILRPPSLINRMLCKNKNCRRCELIAKFHNEHVKRIYGLTVIHRRFN